MLLLELQLFLLLRGEALLARAQKLVQKGPQLSLVVLCHLDRLRVIDARHEVPEDQVGKLHRLATAIQEEILKKLSLRADRRGINCFVFFYARSTFWFHLIEHQETLSIPIGREMEEVGAELRDVELDLNRVPVSQNLQLAEDLVVLLPSVHGQDDVENLSLAR